MGSGHRAAAAAAWLGVAPLLGVHDWRQLAAGVVVAGACGDGKLSPDADQRGVSAKLIPGGHRAITHWWPVPLLIWWGSTHAGLYGWAVLAVAVAWASHVLADAVFGEIPVWPKRGGWYRVGLGLKTGGRIERAATPVLAAVAAWLAWVDVSALAFRG
jgi:membrane-bound metal-dependent hydrolase YbcI (DUF457 family)